MKRTAACVKIKILKDKMCYSMWKAEAFLGLYINCNMNVRRRTCPCHVLPLEGMFALEDVDWTCIFFGGGVIFVRKVHVLIKSINLWGFPYVYDVRKIFGFFVPFPPCHCHKSADFVPFVCFLGTPPPPTHFGRHVWKPPNLVTHNTHLSFSWKELWEHIFLTSGPLASYPRLHA